MRTHGHCLPRRREEGLVDQRGHVGSDLHHRQGDATQAVHDALHQCSVQRYMSAHGQMSYPVGAIVTLLRLKLLPPRPLHTIKMILAIYVLRSK